MERDEAERGDEGGNDDIYSNATLGLVVVIRFDRVPEVRRFILELGGKLVYQKVAPASTKLWVSETPPPEATGTRSRP
jgi:hypothetical protein